MYYKYCYLQRKLFYTKTGFDKVSKKILLNNYIELIIFKIII